MAGNTGFTHYPRHRSFKNRVQADLSREARKGGRAPEKALKGNAKVRKHYNMGVRTGAMACLSASETVSMLLKYCRL